MIFHKASSFGNDFIVVAEGAAGAGADRGGLARGICDRQRGVGADGVVYYAAARFPVADIYLTQFWHSRSAVKTGAAAGV